MLPFGVPLSLFIYFRWIPFITCVQELSLQRRVPLGMESRTCLLLIYFGQLCLANLRCILAVAREQVWGIGCCAEKEEGKWTLLS